jgi:hypothetical protein
MEWVPIYSKWRHGGWYVDNVRYPSGAVGCVSRNYPDGKWRIVCANQDDVTYPTRDAAARAERLLADRMRRAAEVEQVYVLRDPFDGAVMARRPGFYVVCAEWSSPTRHASAVDAATWIGVDGSVGACKLQHRVVEVVSATVDLSAEVVA